MSEQVDWPALLGALILAKGELDQLDEEHLEKYTVPRVKVSPAELEEYERGIGEQLPDTYRDFLLHANGWPSFYFELDLFGLSELRGEGNWGIANQALQFYEEQGIIEEIGLAPEGVIPIGAGPGMRDLILLVRKGWPGAGQVSWLDGEEIERYGNLAEFIASILELKQASVERLRQDSS